MKRFLALFIVFAVSLAWIALPAFAAKKGKSLADEPKSGYAGKLPDIQSEFDYLRPSKQTEDLMKVDESVEVKDLIPAPRKEKMYIDIIKKKDKTSNYLNDVYDIVNTLEKLKVTIIQGASTQVFNAQVSYFIDLAYYLQKEYAEKPESSYISFKRIMELSNQAYSVATLRREASYYGKYLSYNSDGYIYSPEYVNEQLQYLLEAINGTLPILKEAE